MTDTAAKPVPPVPPAGAAAALASNPALASAQGAGTGAGAGAMLRAARQKQGLHIAALATAIKVTPAKLESLEAGRYHELLDITFARALAQTVCRVLKIDPVPVLAQMPGAPPDALGRVDGGLKTPFRERPGRGTPTDWVPWRHPVLWLVAVLLLAAAAFVLVPSGAVRDVGLPGLGGTDPATAPVMPPAGAASDALSDGAAAPAADGTSAAGVAPARVLAAPTATTSVPLAGQPWAGAMPLQPGTTTAPAPAPAPASGDAVALRAIRATWVQAVDGTGQTLMARVVPAGETVQLTATPPLRLRIGNAAGAELTFRGQPVDLRSAARDNIANITLP